MQGAAGTEAFGKPGIEPRWTHSNKDGAGTAYSASSHLWFTIWNGIVTEVYYPTIDRPQLRDLQCLITDGTTFFNTGLLPEQSWDEADRPDVYEWLGKPTGSAMPLMRAHAEYIKLLRSTADGKVYDAIPEVAERYMGKRNDRTRFEVWKPSRQVRFMSTGDMLRVHGDAPFTLRWSGDNWKTTNDSKSMRNALQIDFVDLNDLAAKAGICCCFTFLWTDDNRWEGQDHKVTVR